MLFRSVNLIINLGMNSTSTIADSRFQRKIGLSEFLIHAMISMLPAMNL